MPTSIHTETIARDLGIAIPVWDPDSDDAYVVADALTDVLAKICDSGGDWRHVLVWAHEPRAAVVPPDLHAAEVAALIGCLDREMDEGEARMTVIRRAVNNFRAEHLDPDGGLLDADISAEALAAGIDISLAEAQRRVTEVAFGPLNSMWWGSSGRQFR